MASEFRKTGTADLQQAVDEQPLELMEPKEQLRRLLFQEIDGKPFSELSGVTFQHHGSMLIGHVVLDALEDAGYGVDDFDAIGALTAAAVPIVIAVVHAAASRGEDLDAFVMDFVFPSVKGADIAGKRVLLLDAWLSNKSYVQTSSLITLRRGNELDVDFGVLTEMGVETVAVAALVGGVVEDTHGEQTAEHSTNTITVVNPVTAQQTRLPFIAVYEEKEFLAS